MTAYSKMVKKAIVILILLSSSLSFSMNTIKKLIGIEKPEKLNTGDTIQTAEITRNSNQELISAKATLENGSQLSITKKNNVYVGVITKPNSVTNRTPEKLNSDLMHILEFDHKKTQKDKERIERKSRILKTASSFNKKNTKE